MKLAALIQSPVHQQIESLYQVFSKLHEAEQVTLIILAVVYKPIGITKLEQVIDILKSRGLLTKPKKEYLLTKQSRELLTKQSLLIPNREGLQLNRLLANRLSAEVDQFQFHTLFAFITFGQPQSLLLEIIKAAEQVVPVVSSYGWQSKIVDRNRVIRDFYYLNQIEQLAAAFEFNKNPQVIDHDQNRILVELLFLPFDLAKFLQLPEVLQYQAFASLIRTFQMQGQSLDYPVQLLEQVCDANADRSGSSCNIDCHHLLAEQYLYQMRFDDFERIQDSQDSSSYGLQLQGTYCFLRGDNQQAIAFFEQALRAKNKIAKRKKQYLNEVLGYFYKLALMVHGNQQDLSYFTAAMHQVEFEENDRKTNSDFYHIGQGVAKPIFCLSTGVKYNISIEYHSVDEEVDFFCHQLSYFNYLLAQLWCNNSKDAALAQLALRYGANFNQLAYPLFTQICRQMAASFGNKKPASMPKHESKLIDVTTLIAIKSEWDLALDKLIALNPKTEKNPLQAKETTNKPIRLIWEFESSYEHSLTAREQKFNKSGWSKGRVVSLKRLKEETALFEYLSDSDKRMCQAIGAYQSWGYYAKVEYSLQGLPALQAAVGIDNLYHSDDLSQSIEIIKREPELLVSQHGEQLCLSIADLPIENAQEDPLAARKASQGLKTLIQPFILRRMKNQVLTELPSRTNINIRVEMSAKERDFYEALRLNAIDNISQSEQQANTGEQRIKMLAELVKLRQACCHPKLVMAETDIPSAKLAALNELLEELRLNNHKALIFSQFVGHLQLIKQHVEAMGFSYQYLDGSTPQKQRQKGVNAFQSGEGDVFLISLKAGGSGLNLTAADYVIHMDPWWNPAVEEQASDRAHRIGQTRPVTIYRLITENTIEEKIVALHQHKRDLADKLLEGNEAVTKLSVDDMLNLLKETF